MKYILLYFDLILRFSAVTPYKSHKFRNTFFFKHMNLVYGKLTAVLNTMFDFKSKKI
jgi:hypothetical protein